MAEYLFLLRGELFCRLCIFNEPIDRMGELMDLDLGLGPRDPQFLEAPMTKEELEIFEELIRNHYFIGVCGTLSPTNWARGPLNQIRGLYIKQPY